MKKIFLLFLVFTCCSFAEILSSKDVIKLKKAGVSGKLMAEIIKTNAIYRALATIEGIVEMKKAGVSDDDIISILRAGNPTVRESAREEAKDRLLDREIARRDKLIEQQRRQLDVLGQYLQKLISNKDVIKLVNDGKIKSQDYADIVKYLKQYARDEDTDDDDDGDNIDIDIK